MRCALRRNLLLTIPRSNDALSWSETKVSLTRTGSRRHAQGAALAAALLMVGMAPAPADTVNAVTTPGSGTLTTCRSWVVFNSCDTHKVVLPERIAVGDKLKLTYGSNPKDYNFHVMNIRQQGGGCEILSEASGGSENGEKIEVAQCQTAAKPVSEAR